MLLRLFCVISLTFICLFLLFSLFFSLFSSLLLDLALKAAGHLFKRHLAFVHISAKVGWERTLKENLICRIYFSQISVP
jgi:hypothetical protein